MATKEIINFKSKYEDYEEITENAQPAKNNNKLTKETKARIKEFRLRKLGSSALYRLNLKSETA